MGNGAIKGLRPTSAGTASVPIRRTRLVDDPPARGKLADRIHVRPIEGEIEDRQVFGKPFEFRSARDHDRALLEEEAQGDLPGALAIMSADAPQVVIVTARPRAIGL